jgi:hypothetical protein
MAKKPCLVRVIAAEYGYDNSRFLSEIASEGTYQVLYLHRPTVGQIRKVKGGDWDAYGTYYQRWVKFRWEVEVIFIPE